MSEYIYLSKEKSLVKPEQGVEAGLHKAPLANPAAVLSAPAGPGQSTVRAQAATQLQRSHGNQYVQRVIDRSAEDNQQIGDLARAVDARRGYGHSLPDKTRTQAETVLQQDLSGVRVHTDHHADQLSRQFHAKAFTTGQDVFFRQGAYDPGSSAGDKLLGHELTHVVQQGNSPARLSGAKMSVSKPGDAGEVEADKFSAQITSPAGVSRQEEEEELQMAAVQRQEEQELQMQPVEEEEEELMAQEEEEEELQMQPIEEEEEMLQAQEEEEIQAQVE